MDIIVVITKLDIILSDQKKRSGDEVILTKTVDGNVGIIHSGNPELTGVPMGDFYLDDDGRCICRISSTT